MYICPVATSFDLRMTSMPGKSIAHTVHGRCQSLRCPQEIQAFARGYGDWFLVISVWNLDNQHSSPARAHKSCLER